MKLLRNLKRAKRDPRIDEKKWMNAELLTIEVPAHMVADVQAKINNLYADTTNDMSYDRRSRSGSTNHERSSSRK